MKRIITVCSAAILTLVLAGVLYFFAHKRSLDFDHIQRKLAFIGRYIQQEYGQTGNIPASYDRISDKARQMRFAGAPSFWDDFQWTDVTPSDPAYKALGLRELNIRWKDLLTGSSSARKIALYLTDREKNDYVYYVFSVEGTIAPNPAEWNAAKAIAMAVLAFKERTGRLPRAYDEISSYSPLADFELSANAQGFTWTWNSQSKRQLVVEAPKTGTRYRYRFPPEAGVKFAAIEAPK